MDPVSRLNIMHLQDPLPSPLDFTKQISEALDLVKKKPRRRCRPSGPDSVCPPRLDFAYESVHVPLNTSLTNGFTHEPEKTLITSTGDVQTDDATVKGTKRRRTGGRKGQGDSAGLQDAPSSQSRFSLPVVETLLSESSTPGSGHAACVSSDDSSVIEVPVSVPLTRRVTENGMRGKKLLRNASPNQTEWEVLQDSDSMESRNVPSTSEAENADSFNPTQNGSRTSSSSSSLTSSSLSVLTQKRAPETKKTRSSGDKKASASSAKRRKKKRPGLSLVASAFPSHKPEITLKYASCKEAKRQGRGNTFAPYVRMEFSACTVVNFEEDNDVQARKQRQAMASPGIIPATSCLHLGRLGAGGGSQSGELCCLCGQMANATGLGDLHGPYRPSDPDWKTSADVLINGYEDTGEKRKQVLDEVREHWVHEDCCIWSMGVFLVKGRLYGLDEAHRLAQKAVCSCCQRSGATLGCFFKGCPNKYHFPCALQAECVFNEENFTLRCPKHKSKSGPGVSRLQNR